MSLMRLDISLDVETSPFRCAVGLAGASSALTHARAFPRRTRVNSVG